MSGTFSALGVYVIAEILGGVAAALLYTFVVAKGAAPTMEHGDPQAGKAAGDRTLSTATDTTTAIDTATTPDASGADTSDHRPRPS